MHATLEFVSSVFDRYNSTCFGGVLPRLSIRLSDSLSHLGAFVHPRHWPAGRKRDASQCHIRISRRLDLPESELVNTIVHEMIHYYIWYTATVDNSPHGKCFMHIMNTINSRHGLSMTVSHRSTKSELDTDTRKKPHYICITHWKNGRRLITVCARTRIFDIHAAFDACPDVVGMEWWWSLDPWFNRYGLARSAKAMTLTDDEYERYIGKATRCVCDGRSLRPAASASHR